MTNKNLFLKIIGVLVLAVFVYFVWLAFMKNPLTPDTNNNNGENSAICTMDAMQCPDGSWVGRSGPNCQFVCPIGTSTTPSANSIFLETTIGRTASGLGVTVTPLVVVEDSRCPVDVQCIQAGTVRVQTTLVSGLGTATQVFTLNTPVTTEAEIITLFAVTPVKESGKEISPSNYRFVFKVVKR
ncbi:MAG: hypothetical protein ACAH17_02185 [Candidatus Paceibacterota bacterium]